MCIFLNVGPVFGPDQEKQIRQLIRLQPRLVLLQQMDALDVVAQHTALALGAGLGVVACQAELDHESGTKKALQHRVEEASVAVIYQTKGHLLWLVVLS
jgi:hypothetical protein